MSENTKIEWADHTFNPWEGCQKVGPGCDHCYAEARNSRFNGGQPINWGPGAPRRRTSAANWQLPVKWNAQAERDGRRFRVFCASLADVFDNEVPEQWRADLFSLIAQTPNLDWLLLTKRIGNVDNMLPVPFVNQAEFDRDMPKLNAVDAAVRFISVEPMLGPIVDTEGWLWGTCGKNGVDWVICGGESGRHARPMHPDWARGLRDQCAAAGVPFLFKQWGEWGDPDSIEATGLAHHGWFEQDREDGGVPRHEWPGPMLNGFELASMRPEVYRVGKKAAGRLLDRVEHNGFPS